MQCSGVILYDTYAKLSLHAQWPEMIASVCEEQ